MSGPSSGGGPTDASAGGGEDDSLESSLQAFQSMPKDFNAALEDFRADWQKELKQKQAGDDVAKSDDVAEEEKEAKDVVGPLVVPKETSDQDALAKSYFHKAVELEKRGKVYDAIPFYRKALQIEPNVEFTYYEQQKLKNNAQQQINIKNAEHNQKSLDSQDDLADEDIIDDLYEKFQADLSHNHNGKLILSSRDPGVITTEMHISELPPELLLYIMRWVVSSQLDMRSLEQCAAVCKGMYLVARDEELWRSACVK